LGPDGTGIAAQRDMNTRLRWSISLAAGILTPLALFAEGAADSVIQAVEWIESSHIAELVVAANALTMIP
jgi:hypothetical protein